MSQFKSLKLQVVKRKLDARADRLGKGTAYKEYTRKENLSIKEDDPEKNAKIITLEVNMINVSDELEDDQCWTKEIIDFLQKSIPLEDKIKARRLRMKAARFAIVRGILYKKYFFRPLLRFILKEEAKEILNAIYSRVCGNHFGGRSLAHKAITAGYYWPYMMQDMKEYSKKCQKMLEACSFNSSTL